MGSMGQTGLLFPKPQTKKKRMTHPKSILHKKENQTCYLCIMLHGDYSKKQTTEHHVYFGAKERTISESLGLKVYLCNRHHTSGSGSEAVHGNMRVCRKLQAAVQEICEDAYEMDFMEIFQRNFKEELKELEEIEDINRKIEEKKCPCMEQVGSYAVFCTVNCPNKKTVKGKTVVSKYICIDCEGKEST